MTYATLATMLKYPWTSKHRRNNHDKFGVFQSEIDVFKDIVEEVGLIKKDTDTNCYCGHPLAFLVEAADDICNRILDLEDAVEMKLISFRDVFKILHQLCEGDKGYNEIKENIDSYESNSEKKEVIIPSYRHEMNFLRAKSIGRAVECAVLVFMNNYESIMLGEHKKPLIEECIETKECGMFINDILGEDGKAYMAIKKNVFPEHHKLEIEIGCYSTLGVLLDAFVKAVTEEFMTDQEPSFKSDRVLKLMGPVASIKQSKTLYGTLLLATDYISGMTDNYAISMARQISGTGI